MRASGRRAAALSLLLAALLAGCGGQSQAPPRFFSPQSVWNTPLRDDARLDPSSPAMVAWLLRQVRHEFTFGPAPNIEDVKDSTPIYTVPRNQPTVRVRLQNTQPWGRSLAKAFQAVPIPADARPAAGSDAHLTIWQPSTDRMWEFWEAKLTPSGWQAAWGGAMQHVSSSPGYYSSQSWPGAASYWGSTATSLPVVAGTITVEELRRHQIDHALAISLPAARANEYVWPAQRTDGTDPDPDSIPEGAHLRLDPRLNIAKLHLQPALEAIALAAQKYGLIVRDKTGEALAFYVEAPTAQTGSYPGIFGGIPAYDLLKRFPWSYLELLRMDVHHGTGSP